ncbi:helix-turn-helix domain-containing protein [Virgibacillus kekensis]|uniref:Helix-turn-helix domain-containing protein n=1 Tax=Virgibacillus kekensis TaxID=202261 RepID=A0ABV9DEH9_9BACI
MEIGTRLKEARESKNLSLETLQEKTKIQKRYLEAIEQGNFKVLPGKFYARAFIKEYATAVGLDPNELLEEYKEEIPQSEEEETTQYTRIPRSRRNNNPTKNTAVFSFIPTLIVILLVIGILFAAYYFYQQTATDSGVEPVDRPEDNEVIRSNEEESDGTASGDDTEQETGTDSGDATDEQNNDTETEEPAEPEEPEPKLSLVETGTGASPRSTYNLENAGEEVKVVLEPTGKSWVAVENGSGKTLYTGTLSSEDQPMEVDVTGQDRIMLNVGHAPGLNLKVNGVKVEYPINPEDSDHQYLWINIKSQSEQD